MTDVTNKTRDFSYIAIFTIVLFLLVDFFAGAWLLSIAKRELPKDQFRASHDIYHHTLKPNYNGIGYWGPDIYHVCTNGSAFKDRCENVGKIEKSFDIGFIGDSFTEGVGMTYEDSFVGMVANHFPSLKIANLGVVSYAPSIYLAKLKEFYKQGYSFKNIIVFIDIGDVQDEALTYEVVNGKVLSRHEQLPEGFLPRLRRYASKLLPLTGFLWNKIKAYAQSYNTVISSEQATSIQTTPVAVSEDKNQLQNSSLKPAIHSAFESHSKVNTNAPAMPNAPIEEVSIYERDYTRSSWTYNVNSSGYGLDGVKGTLEKMTRTMEELYELTRINGSTLSVGVYPWPGQIKFDVEDSLQVQVWKNFCTNRCKHFYNSFPEFFRRKAEIGEDAVIYKYYMGGDMHFSVAGNKVIADTLIHTGIQ